MNFSGVSLWIEVFRRSLASCKAASQTEGIITINIWPEMVRISNFGAVRALKDVDFLRRSGRDRRACRRQMVLERQR